MIEFFVKKCIIRFEKNIKEVFMEQVVKTLSEIEERAVKIMEHAASEKKELAAANEAMIAEFDQKVEAETQSKIAKMRSELETELKNELEAQKKQTESTLSGLEADYENNHVSLAKQLMTSIIGE